MAKESPSGTTKTQAQAREAQLREDRLKTALKSNMARRKAQAGARQAGESRDTEGSTDPGEDGS